MRHLPGSVSRRGNRTASFRGVKLPEHHRATSMSRQLFKAIRSGRVLPVRKALAEGADPNARLVKSGITALSEALTCGHVEIARALVEAGAEVNAPDGDGCRPLDVALLYAGRPAVKLLIDRAAIPGAKRETPVPHHPWFALRRRQWLASPRVCAHPPRAPRPYPHPH